MNAESTNIPQKPSKEPIDPEYINTIEQKASILMSTDTLLSNRKKDPSKKNILGLLGAFFPKKSIDKNLSYSAMRPYVTPLQKYLGISQSGSFDHKTLNAVKKWIKENQGVAAITAADKKNKAPHTGSIKEGWKSLKENLTVLKKIIQKKISSSVSVSNNHINPNNGNLEHFLSTVIQPKNATITNTDAKTKTDTNMKTLSFGLAADYLKNQMGFTAFDVRGMLRKAFMAHYSSDDTSQISQNALQANMPQVRHAFLLSEGYKKDSDEFHYANFLWTGEILEGIFKPNIFNAIENGSYEEVDEDDFKENVGVTESDVEILLADYKNSKKKQVNLSNTEKVKVKVNAVIQKAKEKFFNPLMVNIMSAERKATNYTENQKEDEELQRGAAFDSGKQRITTTNFIDEITDGDDGGRIAFRYETDANGNIYPEKIIPPNPNISFTSAEGERLKAHKIANGSDKKTYIYDGGTVYQMDKSTEQMDDLYPMDAGTGERGHRIHISHKLAQGKGTGIFSDDGFRDAMVMLFLQTPPDHIATDFSVSPEGEIFFNKKGEAAKQLIKTLWKNRKHDKDDDEGKTAWENINDGFDVYANAMNKDKNLYQKAYTVFKTADIDESGRIDEHHQNAETIWGAREAHTQKTTEMEGISANPLERISEAEFADALSFLMSDSAVDQTELEAIKVKLKKRAKEFFTGFKELTKKDAYKTIEKKMGNAFTRFIFDIFHDDDHLDFEKMSEEKKVKAGLALFMAEQQETSHKGSLRTALARAAGMKDSKNTPTSLTLEEYKKNHPKEKNLFADLEKAQTVLDEGEMKLVRAIADKNFHIVFGAFIEQQIGANPNGKTITVSNTTTSETLISDTLGPEYVESVRAAMTHNGNSASMKIFITTNKKGEKIFLIKTKTSTLVGTPDQINEYSLVDGKYVHTKKTRTLNWSVAASVSADIATFQGENSKGMITMSLLGGYGKNGKTATKNLTLQVGANGEVTMAQRDGHKISLTGNLSIGKDFLNRVNVFAAEIGAKYEGKNFNAEVAAGFQTNAQNVMQLLTGATSPYVRASVTAKNIFDDWNTTLGVRVSETEIRASLALDKKKEAIGAQLGDIEKLIFGKIKGQKGLEEDLIVKIMSGGKSLSDVLPNEVPKYKAYVNMVRQLATNEMAKRDFFLNLIHVGISGGISAMSYFIAASFEFIYASEVKKTYYSTDGTRMDHLYNNAVAETKNNVRHRLNLSDKIGENGEVNIFKLNTDLHKREGLMQESSIGKIDLFIDPSVAGQFEFDSKTGKIQLFGPVPLNVFYGDGRMQVYLGNVKKASEGPVRYSVDNSRHFSMYVNGDPTENAEAAQKMDNTLQKRTKEHYKIHKKLLELLKNRRNIFEAFEKEYLWSDSETFTFGGLEEKIGKFFTTNPPKGIYQPLWDIFQEKETDVQLSTARKSSLLLVALMTRSRALYNKERIAKRVAAMKKRRVLPRMKAGLGVDGKMNKAKYPEAVRKYISDITVDNFSNSGDNLSMEAVSGNAVASIANNDALSIGINGNNGADTLVADVVPMFVVGKSNILMGKNGKRFQVVYGFYSACCNPIIVVKEMEYSLNVYDRTGGSRDQSALHYQTFRFDTGGGVKSNPNTAQVYYTETETKKTKTSDHRKTTKKINRVSSSGITNSTAIGTSGATATDGGVVGPVSTGTKGAATFSNGMINTPTTISPITSNETAYSDSSTPFRSWWNN